MRAGNCPRAWEAEAVGDGRLDGVERGSFERHVATCEVCAHERSVLAQLDAVAKRLPKPTSTPLERRRLRIAILSSANRQTLRESWFHPRRLFAIASASMLVAAAIGYGLWRHPSPIAATIPSWPAPTFDVRPLGNAEWHLDRGGPESQLRLTEGVILLHVGKLDAGQRFLLMLPDGELEVRGTRFIAEVHGEHTDRVQVAEGNVMLRLRSESHLLGAGQSWHRDPVVSGQVDTPATVSPSPRTPSPDQDRKLGAAGERHARAASTNETSIDRSLRVSAGATFAAAMSAFDAGLYSRAEELFSEFERISPADARSEDVDFLRILIRSRLGDERGARQRAHGYLAHHPKGLRQGEVEAFLRRPPSAVDDER